MTYYVYGLTDPTRQGARGDDLISSVFYVGKGAGDRLDHHHGEVQMALRTGLAMDELTNQAKVQRILTLLEQGSQPRSVKLASGLQSEADAYIAEALAIELVNEVLRARGLDGLTNAVAGHGRAIMDLDEHRRFVEASDLHLEPVIRQDGPGVPTDATGITAGDVFSAVFVKMGSHDFDALEHRPTARHPPVRAEAEQRVVVMDSGIPAGVRAGWNPNVPWTPEQAHERANRYWPIRRDQVEQWILDSSTMPRYLVGLIPDRGRSIARFVWPIDPVGRWQLFPSVRNRWGIPVVDPLSPLSTHPLVGRRPVNRDGRGILGARANGVRYGAFRAL